ncbi:MAG: winged helix-turn-helix transcriptional regulator [Planctomycetota bacterium]|nr:MAG: winged helix-turn-helix transcriptional regulator [Planctomycetota bacterium]
MKNGENFFGNAHLDVRHWQNIPETSGRWYSYNHERKDRLKKNEILSLFIPLLNRIILNDLTYKQQQALILRFRGHTQSEIAEKLNISQPAVNQHLIGKKRRGKKVGGALKKIRKKLLILSQQSQEPSDEAELIRVVGTLLDQAITRRKATNLLQEFASRISHKISSAS